MNWIFLATGILIGVSLTMAFIALASPPDRTSARVGALEVADVFERIATGKTALKNIYPDESFAAVELETTDGWCIVLAFDDDRLFEVEMAVAPDDRQSNAADWASGPAGRNPLDILRERDPELVGMLALKAVQKEMV